MINTLAKILEKINGTVALAFSHQREDVAVLDMLLKCRRADIEIFTLDTLKLFTETYSFNNEIENFFKVEIKRYYPDTNAARELDEELGESGIRESVENRKRCCRVRKVDGLKTALSGKSAWITGLRAAQSVTRTEIDLLEYDKTYGLIKINPIVHWSGEDVKNYTKEHSLPVHPLYSSGYKSIGCAPCTRPVEDEEDERAGRWWWEDFEKKECGLHLRMTDEQA